MRVSAETPQADQRSAGSRQLSASGVKLSNGADRVDDAVRSGEVDHRAPPRAAMPRRASARPSAAPVCGAAGPSASAGACSVLRAAMRRCASTRSAGPSINTRSVALHRTGLVASTQNVRKVPLWFASSIGKTALELLLDGMANASKQVNINS